MAPTDVQHYVPYFDIYVNGLPFHYGKTLDILSLSVTDTVNQADSFTFTVRDRHPKPGRFAGGAKLRWMDDTTFDEGNVVKIQLGYVNRREFKFEGEITALSASFPESGLPTLTVRGFSYYHRLQRARSRKPFEAETDSGIAAEIAGRMGWGAIVEDTRVERPILSPGEATYGAILTQRAQRLNYEVTVKGSTLYFQPPRYLADLSPQETLEWGRNLRSFSPSLTTYNMVTEVTVRGSQTSRGGRKEALVGKAEAKTLAPKMGAKTGPEIALDTFKVNPLLHSDHDIETQQEANSVAAAQLHAKAIEFISGRGSCIGMPNLKARMVIELKGLGERFSGKYYVTSVTHTIDAGGYRTDFQVKRNGR